jgi:hypothetical protein
MYPNDIKKEDSAIKGAAPTKIIHSVFEKHNLQPLVFEPDEYVVDQTYIARGILHKRNDSEIIIISKAVSLMQRQGFDLAHSLCHKMFKETPNRPTITMTEGKMLYLVCDYFDLSSLKVKNLDWGDIFATLTLMLSAEILVLKHAKGNVPTNEFEQAIMTTSDIDIQEYKEEIIDSIARTECLFDKKQSLTKSGSAGGEAKAKRIEPLKVDVITRYLKRYTSFSNKKAGVIIEAEFDAEKSDLLLLSEAEEKNLLFSQWIGVVVELAGHFNKG